MPGLVMSLFTGLGVLDHGFRLEGYCVVSAGDLVRSSLDDVRQFHPPTGLFEGVIGGDPCQSHSALANLVRAKGLEPSFPDMTGEYQRIVEEARPRWFLRENVPQAPDCKPAGYDVRSFLLDHSTMDRGDGTGHEQMRKRRFWFGVRDRECPELRQWIDFAMNVLPDRALSVKTAHDHLDGADKIAQRRQTLCADPRAVPVAIGGSGKRKSSVTGRHEAAIGVTGGHAGNPPRYSIAEMLELQGLPADLFAYSPFTMQGKRKLVGNAVPLPMASALARAVRCAMEAGEAYQQREARR